MTVFCSNESTLRHSTQCQGLGESPLMGGEMKERPILMSAPMARAILAGRKTQTRRVVKCRDVTLSSSTKPFDGPNLGTDSPQEFCPYGVPGDRLWVRETWRWDDCLDNGMEPETTADQGMSYIGYRADGRLEWRFHDLATVQRWEEKDECLKSHTWRPSIFMPRWASRLALEIVSVKAERLQDIGRYDAQAEGVWDWSGKPGSWGEHEDGGYCAKTFACQCKDAFPGLWESINGKGSWDANPWVWVVEFARVDQASNPSTDVASAHPATNVTTCSHAEGKQEEVLP